MVDASAQFLYIRNNFDHGVTFSNLGGLLNDLFVFSNADGLVGVAMVRVDIIRNDWSVVMWVMSTRDNNEDLEWETSVGTLGQSKPGWESVDLLWLKVNSF